VTRIAELKVQLVGYTTFVPPCIGEDADGQPIYWTGAHAANRIAEAKPGSDAYSPYPESAVPGRMQSLVEFAGRSCYESFDHPNPRTASNKGYLANTQDHGHGSIEEHASVSFYVTGVSRSLTHELIRHRHLSYSELSQRFVDVTEAKLVVPPALEDSDISFQMEQKHVSNVYGHIVHILQNEGVQGKKAREAARAVMPNMTESKIVVTGNLRAWKEFLIKRDSPHADAEIRRLAQEIGGQLAGIAPNLFGGSARAIWQDNEDQEIPA
jgi:thymidylate synthase (FAD)